MYLFACSKAIHMFVSNKETHLKYKHRPNPMPHKNTSDTRINAGKLCFLTQASIDMYTSSFCYFIIHISKIKPTTPITIQMIGE